MHHTDRRPLHEEAGADCVDGSRLQENTVAHMRLELMDALVDRPGGGVQGQLLSVDSWIQSGIDLAPRFRGQHDPGFGLAPVGRIELLRLLIVGVNLHGEILVSVEKLEKQRKALLWGVASQELQARFAHELVERSASQWSGDDATLIGAMGGVLVVFSIITLDKLKIDDPVGAISVHGVVGVWGLLAVLLSNGDATLGAQLLGLVSIFVWTFVASLIVWGIIKAVIGIRVSEEEEYEGVDIGECGLEAYPEFTGSKGSGL